VCCAAWCRSTRGPQVGSSRSLSGRGNLIPSCVYRLLIGHAPLDEAGVDAIVDAAMRGLAPGD
jgi:hypothetical protein